MRACQPKTFMPLPPIPATRVGHPNPAIAISVCAVFLLKVLELTLSAGGRAQITQFNAFHDCGVFVPGVDGIHSVTGVTVIRSGISS